MNRDAMRVEWSAEGRRVDLVLDRPEKLNPLSLAVCDALAEELHVLADRPAVSVVVLRGEGRSFSAGADLSRDGQLPLDTDWVTRRHDHGRWQRVLEAFDRLGQVSVARLQGHVIGGATLLAAACDVRIAADDVVFRVPEVAMGIPLTWAGVPLLVREVGLPRARDWILSGRDVSPDELATSGFAQHVVARDLLDDTVEAYVAALLAQPPAALAMTRAMTSALGRSHPAMVAAWADADLLQWSLREGRPT
jgi:enoyl-CoA hydratase/carnithine racemase